MEMADRVYQQYDVRAPALPEKRWQLITIPVIGLILIGTVGWTFYEVYRQWPGWVW